eukprot:TRINITY_DN2257_c0_g1_i2.p1 TRINITY_DN2257_c0_g1~~TRINITY_DN2257_c0_g1_i2.p1  ORF type:complete len:525 (-),score=138.06 TRINITY_DN2257_c0_g1_i2:57-1631(-)
MAKPALSLSPSADTLVLDQSLLSPRQRRVTVSCFTIQHPELPSAGKDLAGSLIWLLANPDSALSEEALHHEKTLLANTPRLWRFGTAKHRIQFTEGIHNSVELLRGLSTSEFAQGARTVITDCAFIIADAAHFVKDRESFVAQLLTLAGLLFALEIQQIIVAIESLHPDDWPSGHTGWNEEQWGFITDKFLPQAQLIGFERSKIHIVCVSSRGTGKNITENVSPSFVSKGSLMHAFEQIERSEASLDSKKLKFFVLSTDKSSSTVVGRVCGGVLHSGQSVRVNTTASGLTVNSIVKQRSKETVDTATNMSGYLTLHLSKFKEKDISAGAVLIEAADIAASSTSKQFFGYVVNTSHSPLQTNTRLFVRFPLLTPPQASESEVFSVPSIVYLDSVVENGIEKSGSVLGPGCVGVVRCVCDFNIGCEPFRFYQPLGVVSLYEVISDTLFEVASGVIKSTLNSSLTSPPSTNKSVFSIFRSSSPAHPQTPTQAQSPPGSPARRSSTPLSPASLQNQLSRSPSQTAFPQ